MRSRLWARPVGRVCVSPLKLTSLLLQYPTYAQEHASCIAYATHTPLGTQAAVAYVIATCAPALLSSRRYLQWFGVANIIGVAIALSVREVDFTSIWCVYAALVSVLILEHFRRQRQAEAGITGSPRAATTHP